MAAPSGTAGSRSPGTTTIVTPSQLLVAAGRHLGHDARFAEAEIR